MTSGGPTSSAAAARALLRALAVGLSVHLLYRDNPDASAIVDACERVREVAHETLAGGAVRVEVRSARFLLDDEPITGPGLDRLATACFERRVERLGFEQVPSIGDLQAWYGLLAARPERIEELDGMDAALRAHGVSTIVATARTPMPHGGDVDDIDPELLALADWLDATAAGAGGDTAAADDASTAAALDTGAAESVQRAPELYTRLSELAEGLTAQESARSSFYSRAAELVDRLPRSERAVFGITVIDRAGSEVFAERFAGHLTDEALADLISDVAWLLGQDPSDLADELVVRLGRHVTVADLLRTGAARLLGPVDVDAVADLPDGSTLLAGFPSGERAERRLAIAALVDVLLNDPREDQLTPILERITARLRTSFAAGDADSLAELVAAIDRVAELGTTELVGQLHAARAGAIDVDAVREAVRSDGSRHVDPSLVVPFGTHAIGPLIDALAGDADGKVRTVLLGALELVGRGQAPLVAAALDRQPPETALRLAPLVGPASGLDTVAVLAELADRAGTSVQHELIDALRHRDPVRAAPIIAKLTRATDDAELRSHGLRALAALPNGGGRSHLEALASRTGTRRLPWRTRRRARRLARRVARS